MDCILDWCSLTIKKIYGKPATWEKVVSEVLEMDFSQFTELKGNYGYKLQKYSEGIRVYYDGNEDMGIHLQISGDGMRRLENRKNFTWDCFLRNAFFFDAKITRLDVAIDDKEGYINMETLNDKINKGECISKFKSCNTIHKQLISNGETAGKTINFGSNTSKIKFRIYDKLLEQGLQYDLIKMKENGIDIKNPHWVRFEMQLRDDRAEVFSLLYADRDNNLELGEMAKRVINNYLKFVDSNELDTNRSRWATSQFWITFIDTLEKLKLTIQKPKKKLEDVYFWLEKSVAPSLAMIVKASGGDLTELDKLVINNSYRLTKKHEAMINDFFNEAIYQPYTENDEIKQKATEIIKEKISNLDIEQLSFI